MENKTFFKKEIFESKKYSILLVKPHAIESTIKILTYLTDCGYNIVLIKNFVEDIYFWEIFYDEHKTKLFFKELTEQLKNRMTIAMLLYNEFKIDSIKDLREIIGNTDPRIAKIGSIRYSFGINKMYNAVHSSADLLSMIKEFKLIFNEYGNI